MLRFLAITVAVCSLFVQDAQATAVASNTRREIELEEELLRVSWRVNMIPTLWTIIIKYHWSLINSARIHQQGAQGSRTMQRKNLFLNMTSIYNVFAKNILHHRTL